MSELKVEVVKVSQVIKHPNADRLDIVEIKGWLCVVAKDTVKKDDKVIYIPIDSILPPELEAKIFGPDSKVKLSNSRVRTIKLRGAVSQGLVVTPELVGLNSNKLKIGDNVTKELGITKFEPKESQNKLTSGLAAGIKSGRNPNFHKYTDIENFKNYPDLFEVGEDVVITEKIHGCLQANTKILLDNGSSIPIKKIVEEKLNVKILGTDKKGNLISTTITNWYNNGKEEHWKNIFFERKEGSGNHFGKITCTDNHKFYVPKYNKYISAKKIKNNDDVILIQKIYNIPQFVKDVLIGKMLGDGSLSNNSVQFSHKVENNDYLEYTLNSLGFLKGKKQTDTISGYGTAMVRGRSKSNKAIELLFKNWFKNNKKIVPNIKLSPISLAFWYMDDGSLCHTTTQQDRALFATCGFDEKSVDNLIKALDELGLKGIKFLSDNKYWRIRLNYKDADKMFKMIAPYICSDMKYKLPEKYRNVDLMPLPLNCYKQQFTFIKTIQKIIKIEDVSIKYINKMNKNKYDLETTTHNFFANNVLVHNSNFRCGWVKSCPNTKWQKIKKWLGLLPEYQFCFGSHHVQLQSKMLYSGYYDSNVYAKIVKQYHLREILPKGYVLYGEIYGHGIQKNYEYGCGKNEHKLVVFDIEDQVDKQRFLNYGELCDFCWKELTKTLPVVPILYTGPYSKEIVEQLVEGASVLDPKTLVKEGIVIREQFPDSNKFCIIGRRILKRINDTYLLDKNNTDFH